MTNWVALMGIFEVLALVLLVTLIADQIHWRMHLKKREQDLDEKVQELATVEALLEELG